MAPFRRTGVVEGPLAFQMRRLAAARANDSGLQIFNLPQVAARLAGGFLYPVTPELLEPVIRLAVEQGGFAELDSVRELPGITRAVARTLRHAWNADIDLSDMTKRDGAARLCDLAIIEQRVRSQIPSSVMLPRDIRDVALEKAHRAPACLGPVRIEQLSWIAPLWRPLLNRLCKTVPVEWEAPEGADAAWFSGTLTRIPKPDGIATLDLVSCADPHHEVVEALRWVRNLISSGTARPSDIALAAAHPEAWDEHFLALAADTGIRIHFSHGVPALSTRDGQRCAALADVLLRGLSEARVRRLVTLCHREGGIVDRLPSNWLAALPRGATLLTLADWQRACEGMVVDGQPCDAKAILLPWLATLERGPGAARDAAASTLVGRTRRIWDAATRSAPAHAIELTLQNIRLPAETDAGDSVVWGPAAHLASSPRSRVRLLGLTSRAWPRRGGADPILPDHLVPARELDPDPVPEADRRNFAVINASAGVELALSRNRRGPQGSRVGPSPLLPQECAERALSRARLPAHAFSEADRLMARPAEAVSVPSIASASLCWRNWHSESFTAHDGRYGADHRVITGALARTQSATSLQLLLRGPLGFVWKYALGWRAPEDLQQPLTITPEDFGKLVHELLRRTVDALEPTPGFGAATREEIESAMAAAAQSVRESWPLERPVPPRLLWSNTVDHGARMAIAALSEEITQTDTRSWTEVPFGNVNFAAAARELPWDATIPVTIPDTAIRIQGAIDRLDLRTASHAVRVTDYKTGKPPQAPERIVIGGGAELQRSLYALACRQLLPDIRHIMARLAYLSDPPLMVRLDDLDGALAKISEFVSVGCALLGSGTALPGRDADSATNDLRLAMPASPGYLRRKAAKFAQAAGRLSSFWDAR
jgi:hypothetical protein